MPADSEGSVPDGVGQTFVQCYQVLGQLPVNCQVGRMNFATYQLAWRSVICGCTAKNGVEVVEPQKINVQVVQCGAIFLTPVRYRVDVILWPEASLSQHLRRK